MLMTLAVMTAVGSAVANRPKAFCEDFTQYYRGAGGYQWAGEFGVDYVCLTGLGICTYYRPSPILMPNAYQPCRYGVFTFAYINKEAPGKVRDAR